MPFTSEDHHGITEQPKPLCPKINGIIIDINKAHSALESASSKDSADILYEITEKAFYHIDGLETKMEEIRTQVEAIRTWGQEWKDKAKELHEENKTLQQALSKYEQ